RADELLGESHLVAVELRQQDRLAVGLEERRQQAGPRVEAPRLRPGEDEREACPRFGFFSRQCRTETRGERSLARRRKRLDALDGRRAGGGGAKDRAPCVRTLPA